jgi:hypothetical protein
VFLCAENNNEDAWNKRHVNKIVLLFEPKTRSRVEPKVKFLAWSTNIRLGLNYLWVTNPLLYQIKTVKSFIVLTLKDIPTNFGIGLINSLSRIASFLDLMQESHTFLHSSK